MGSYIIVFKNKHNKIVIYFFKYSGCCLKTTIFKSILCKIFQKHTWEIWICFLYSILQITSNICMLYSLKTYITFMLIWLYGNICNIQCWISLTICFYLCMSEPNPLWGLTLCGISLSLTLDLGGFHTGPDLQHSKFVPWWSLPNVNLCLTTTNY